MSNLNKAFEAANPGIEQVMIDLTQPGHAELLKAAYEDVFVPAFPIEDERTPLELWLSILDPASEAPIKYSVIVTGTHLFARESRRIDGVSSGIYYTQADVGLIGYNAVRPGAQGMGLGTVMIKGLNAAFQNIADARHKNLRGIFVEVNDPAKISAEEDNFDPVKRLAIYHRWGAREVPIRYVQPALQPDQQKFDKLKLLYFSVKGEAPKASAIRDFLYTMYEQCGYVPESDESFAAMAQEIGQTDFGDGIRLQAQSGLLEARP